MLLDTLEDASGSFPIHWVSDHVHTTSLAQIWAGSLRGARWLASNTSGPVAMALTNTPEAVRSMFGAWIAGRRVVSVPQPSRTMSPERYCHHIAVILEQTGASTLLVDRGHLELARSFELEAQAFDLLDTGGSSTRFDSDPGLTQFTSGTSGSPKGVELGLEAILTNINGVLSRLRPEPGDVACSWLPLSHDMGLIGMFLSGYVAAGAPWTSGNGAMVRACVRTTCDVPRSSVA